MSEERPLITREYRHLPELREVLADARDLLSDPERYDPHAPFALTAAGDSVWPTHPSTTKFSLRGALIRAGGRYELIAPSSEAIWFLQEVIEKGWGLRREVLQANVLDCFDILVSSHAQVMKAFNLAIAIADRRLARKGVRS